MTDSRNPPGSPGVGTLPEVIGLDLPITAAAGPFWRLRRSRLIDHFPLWRSILFRPRALFPRPPGWIYLRRRRGRGTAAASKHPERTGRGLRGFVHKPP